MLRRSACGMNRRIFCEAVWVHPIEGTERAKTAAAAANVRNLCVNETMLSLFGNVLTNLRDPCQRRQCKSRAEHPLPRVRGRVRVGVHQTLGCTPEGPDRLAV